MYVIKIKSEITYNYCVNGSWVWTSLKQKIVTITLATNASVLDLSIVSRSPLRMRKHMI